MTRKGRNNHFLPHFWSVYLPTATERGLEELKTAEDARVTGGKPPTMQFPGWGGENWVRPQRETGKDAANEYVTA